MNENDQLIETIKLAQSGSHEAFEALYHSGCNPVYFLALKITGSKDVAEDIMQDTFISVFKEIKSLDNPPAYKTWINRIVINKCKNYLLKSKDKLLPDIEESGFEEKADKDEEFLPHAALDKAETREMIMKVIDSLPPEQRMSVLLYYYQELSVLQIAEIMDCPPNTVKSRLFYGRQQIKLAIEEHEKQGVKLYGAVPVPMLTELLRGFAENNKLSEKTAERLLKGVFKGAGKITNAAAGAKTNLFAKITSMSVKAKVITSAVAAVIVASAITAAILIPAMVNPVGINAGASHIGLTSKSGDGKVSSVPAAQQWPPKVEQSETLSGLRNNENTAIYSLLENGGYVYFFGTDTAAGQSNISCHIYRCNRDGTNLVDLLGDSNRYQNIFKAKNPSIEGNASPYNISYIKDDRLYVMFSLLTSDVDANNIKISKNQLYSVDLNGNDLRYEQDITTNSQPGVTSNPYVTSISDGGWVYVSNAMEKKIYRQKTDGTDQEVLYDGIALELEYRDGWLYFISTYPGTNQGAISCLNTETKVKKDLYTCDMTKFGISRTNLCGNWIYFTGAANGASLYRVGTDGTGFSKVSDKPVSGCAIFGHTILFYNWFLETDKDGKQHLTLSYSNVQLQRMDLDGSNEKAVS
jgi:RNA polymerase sigma factor (sigma-70 family)